MKDFVHQGDILNVEKIKNPVLVVSKDFFNKTGQIIGCPVFDNDNRGPLHIIIKTGEITGCVQCEKLALLDLSFRGYKIIDKLLLPDLINITDAIQAIFDYM